MVALFLWLAQLPGTVPLAPMADPAMEMLDGVHAWLDARTASAAERRAARPGDRALLRELIGAVDARAAFTELARVGGEVRWPVVSGVEARGNISWPQPKCYHVILGGALGAARGNISRRDCLTIATGAIDRTSTLAGNPRLKKQTAQTHREFVYRMAFEVGRHVLGYEAQKVLALVDWFSARTERLPIYVTGVNDGALAALMACALDERISGCRMVNLRFEDRALAENPIDQNIWRFSEHFDQARLLALIRPRGYEAVQTPEAAGLAAPLDEVSAWIEHTQRLVREAGWKRAEWFGALAAEEARRRFWEELIGKFPEPLDEWRGRVAVRPRYDEAEFVGYEVKIPVRGPVFAYGHLLVPKDLKPGQRRPLVVCQHGLNGRPEDTVLKEKQRVVYDEFAAKLVRMGYIVYAPQNFYIHEERFRTVQRKANPLGLTLFSFIIAQHQQHLNWLETLPFVDAARIGFYGLSYGGKTAMRVPPVEPRYKVVICSGDFNEWLWKITSVEEPFSYMFTREYEMLEWNLGHTFNYFEMAALVAPRPFMVERGHDDGVGIDEWVAYEYAKVRRHYAKLGLAEKTEIEFFPGPHRIWGVGTFEFLRKHLGAAR
jgi:hypothetical protein